MESLRLVSADVTSDHVLVAAIESFQQLTGFYSDTEDSEEGQWDAEG